MDHFLETSRISTTKSSTPWNKYWKLWYICLSLKLYIPRKQETTNGEIINNSINLPENVEAGRPKTHQRRLGRRRKKQPIHPRKINIKSRRKMNGMATKEESDPTIPHPYHDRILNPHLTNHRNNLRRMSSRTTILNPNIFLTDANTTTPSLLPSFT